MDAHVHMHACAYTQVRHGYKIQNGDVLTPLRTTTLNSDSWLGARNASLVVGASARGTMPSTTPETAPAWQSLPVPYLELTQCMRAPSCILLSDDTVEDSMG